MADLSEILPTITCKDFRELRFLSFGDAIFDYAMARHTEQCDDCRKWEQVHIDAFQKAVNEV